MELTILRGIADFLNERGFAPVLQCPPAGRSHITVSALYTNSLWYLDVEDGQLIVSGVMRSGSTKTLDLADPDLLDKLMVGLSHLRIGRTFDGVDPCPANKQRLTEYHPDLS